MFEGRLTALMNGGLLFEYMEYTEKVEIYQKMHHQLSWI